MADTKISGATDVVTLSGTDKFPLARSASTTKYYATATEIGTFVLIGMDSNITVPMAVITAQAGALVVAWRATFAGTVEGVNGTVNAAFTATDIVITSKINTTNITTGVVTIPTAGSAALTSVAVIPTAAKTFAIGDIINFTITGGVGTVNGVVGFVLRRT